MSNDKGKADTGGPPLEGGEPLPPLWEPSDGAKPAEDVRLGPDEKWIYDNSSGRWKVMKFS
jgi:hypothetical protein